MLPNDCEDIAIEAVAEMVGKVRDVHSEGELKPLVAAIARNKAVDLLRRQSSERRGGNRVESLDSALENGRADVGEASFADPFDHLAAQELKEVLVELAEQVKTEYRVVLKDHFFDELTYSQIAERRGISVGSVGVYLQRGLAALRSVLDRRPSLRGEFLSAVSDAVQVRVLLPLLSALQLGGWFLDQHIRYQEVSIPLTNSSEEDRLRAAEDLIPAAHALSENGRHRLFERLRAKYPAQLNSWRRREEAGRAVQDRDGSGIGCVVVLALAATLTCTLLILLLGAP